MAAPAALIPQGPRLRHRARALRARAIRGVDVRGRPLLGRGVVLDVDPGSRILLGDGCVVGDGTRIHARNGTVSIGDGSVLGERCALVALAGIEIGRRCLIGDDAILTDFGPETDDVERPVREQGVAAQPIRVGDGARVGHGACLLPGVRLGPGANVGPHAVVMRDVPPGMTVEGASPAATMPAAAGEPGASPAAQPPPPSGRSRR